MTDSEAVAILLKPDIATHDEFLEAIVHAGNRLIATQWHDYDPEEFNSFKYDANRPAFGTKVILGIRYDDGSCGTVNGFVLFSNNVWSLAISGEDKTCYTEKATIEKWMYYPNYDG